MGTRLTLSTAKTQQVVGCAISSSLLGLWPQGGDLDSRELILYLPQPYSEDLDFFHWFPHLVTLETLEEGRQEKARVVTGGPPGLWL